MPIIERTATVIGATGLVGSNLVKLLIRDDYFNRIRIISRRPLEYNHVKVSVIVIDFLDYKAFKEAISGSDSVFCTVGTTRKKVKGDMSEYRKVDFDIPVFAAKFCSETSCPAFLLVSSVGADINSRNFYLKIKGETESAVIAASIKSLSIFRPSMLLGKRNEVRTVESIAQAITRQLIFLFPEKYKPIQADVLAASMIAFSKKKVPGFHIYHYYDMVNSLNEKSTASE
ncbi:MAG TPA: NAD(P)H-binding protein [Bacteroidales bacterium]|nr:NAD(P)H-binding protein [Bacteroidales bacterium]